MADLALAPQDLPAAATLLSLLVYPHDALRAPAAVLARNQLGQRSLWKHAISGDLPILLVRIGAAEEAAVLPSVLRAHRLWRGRGAAVDVVILNERAEGYLAETAEHIDRAIAQADADAWRDRPGGVFVVASARIAEAERILLLSSAGVVLDGSQGSIGQQLARVRASRRGCRGWSRVWRGRRRRRFSHARTRSCSTTGSGDLAPTAESTSSISRRARRRRRRG